MTYIMSCVWLDYMVKYFQCKNCVGSSPKTKKCVASFLVPGDRLSLDAHCVPDSVFYCNQMPVPKAGIQPIGPTLLLRLFQSVFHNQRSFTPVSGGKIEAQEVTRNR